MKETVYTVSGFGLAALVSGIFGLVQYEADGYFSKNAVSLLIGSGIAAVLFVYSLFQFLRAR